MVSSGADFAGEKLTPRGEIENIKAITSFAETVCDFKINRGDLSWTSRQSRIYSKLNLGGSKNSNSGENM
jgi:hypothetical protein